MIMASFMCQCGTMTFSYIITTLKLIYTNSKTIMPLAKLKEECEETLTQMEKKTQRKMNMGLISDYLNFVLFSYNSDYKLFQTHSFYRCLRRDIAHELNCNLFDLLKKKFSLFFKEFNPHLANLLILKLQSKVYMKEEVVIQADHSSPGIYFIYSGKVIVQMVNLPKNEEEPKKTSKLNEKPSSPTRRQKSQLSHSILSTYTKIKSYTTFKTTKEPTPNFQETILELHEGSFFGEDFILGKRPLFNYIASDSESSSVLKVLFVPFPVILFLLETEFHEGSNRWLLSLAFRRRLLFLVVFPLFFILVVHPSCLSRAVQKKGHRNGEVVHQYGESPHQEKQRNQKEKGRKQLHRRESPEYAGGHGSYEKWEKREFLQ